MRRILFSLIIISGLFISFQIKSAFNPCHASTKKNVYFFEAKNCPACASAKRYFNSPPAKKRFKDMNFITYLIYDEAWNVRATEMRMLVSKLEKLKRKHGTKNFIYQDRKDFEYYTKKGLPYYRRQERYSRKDDRLPTPVFIIGDMVYVGFNKNVVIRAIEDYLD